MFLEKYNTVEIPEFPIYAMYLRKSREDKEVQAGDTLKRHKDQLDALAQRLGIMVQEKYIFTEVVSGETLAARPEMQKLLALMETGLVIGVLVVEDTRLTRGDKIDQGVIQNTFKYTNTKIITPSMVYNLYENEADSNMLDLRFMFSNMELINTTRRLNNGRKASVNEGKYVGQKAPWGYIKYKLEGQKGYSLKIDEEEAYYIRLIYDTFIETHSYNAICNRLTAIGKLTSTGRAYTGKYMREIMENPIYKGYVSYSRRKTVKKMVGGEVVKCVVPNDDFQLVKGLHEGIVSEEKWEMANSIIKGKNIPKVNKNKEIRNELAGIIKCGCCGKQMRATADKGVFERTGHRYLGCINKACNNKGYRVDLVSNAIIDSLEEWLSGYTLEYEQESKSTNNKEIYEKALDTAKAELDTVKKQINKISDLFEQDIYDIEKFTERNSVLKEKEKELLERIDNIYVNLKAEKEIENNKEIVLPQCQSIIEALRGETNIEKKNKLFKQILVKAEYVRPNPHSKDIQIKIYPKLPKSL